MEGQKKTSRFSQMGCGTLKGGCARTYYPDPLKDTTVNIKLNANPAKYARTLRSRQYFAFGDSFVHMFMHASNAIHMKFKGKTLKGLAKEKDQHRQVIAKWAQQFRRGDLVFCFGQVDLNFSRYYKLVHNQSYPQETMREYVRWVATFKYKHKCHIIGILACAITRQNILTVLRKYHILEEEFDEQPILQEYDRTISQRKRWNDILEDECQRQGVSFINIFDNSGLIGKHFIDQNPKTIHLRYLPCLLEIQKRLPGLKIDVAKAQLIESSYQIQKTQRYLQNLSREEAMEAQIESEQSEYSSSESQTYSLQNSEQLEGQDNVKSDFSLADTSYVQQSVPRQNTFLKSQQANSKCQQSQTDSKQSKKQSSVSMNLKQNIFISKKQSSMPFDLTSVSKCRKIIEQGLESCKQMIDFFIQEAYEITDLAEQFHNINNSDQTVEKWFNCEKPTKVKQLAKMCKTLSNLSDFQNPFKKELISIIQTNFEQFMQNIENKNYEKIFDSRLIGLIQFIAELIQEKVLRKKLINVILEPILVNICRVQPEHTSYLMEVLLTFLMTLGHYCKFIQKTDNKKMYQSALQTLYKHLKASTLTSTKIDYGFSFLVGFSFSEYLSILKIINNTVILPNDSRKNRVNHYLKILDQRKLQILDQKAKQQIPYKQSKSEWIVWPQLVNVLISKENKQCSQHLIAQKIRFVQSKIGMNEFFRIIIDQTILHLQQLETFNLMSIASVRKDLYDQQLIMGLMFEYLKKYSQKQDQKQFRSLLSFSKIIEKVSSYHLILPTDGSSDFGFQKEYSEKIVTQQSLLFKKL